jgi:2'-5' RNA ligase
MRCFIAICLPDMLKRGLAEVQDSLKVPGIQVGWARPDGIHLTLKFLGEVEEKDISRISGALSRAVDGVAPFVGTLRGVGCFPGMSTPRVVWIGIEEPEGILRRLQQNIEKSMEDIGFPAENRSFKPHLTLGRVRSLIHREALIRQIEKNKDPDLGSFEVREVHVMQSILKPEGAVHVTLASVVLKG